MAANSMLRFSALALAAAGAAAQYVQYNTHQNNDCETVISSSVYMGVPSKSESAFCREPPRGGWLFHVLLVERDDAHLCVLESRRAEMSRECALPTAGWQEYAAVGAFGAFGLVCSPRFDQVLARGYKRGHRWRASAVSNAQLDEGNVAAKSTTRPHAHTRSPFAALLSRA